jgi:hypothetical protein
MASMDTQGYHDGVEVIAHYWPDLMPTRQEILKNIRTAVSTEWDAVVMSGFPSWPKYPPDIRRSILEKVSSGRLLMIRGLHDMLIKELEAMGIKLEGTSIGAGRFPFRVGKNGVHLGQARVYRCGKGHVIRFKAHNHPAIGNLLSDSHRQSDFEFSTARAGWFLHRGARPGARPYVTGTRFADGDIVVALDAGVRARDGRVQVAVHRRDTYEKVLDVRATTKPGNPVTVALPQVPGGDYQAHVRITNREGVTLDWDALRFTVTGDVRLKQFTVDPREDLKPGDNVTCRLEVEGETAGLKTVARWYDQWDRLLIQTAAEPFAQDMQITAPAGSLSVLNRLEVTISSDRGPEATGRVELLMPGNVRPTDFHMLYWRAITWNEYAPHSSWRGRLQWDVLRRDGAADAWANARHHGPEARNAALCHLRTVPYATALNGLRIDEEGKNSLLNEQYMAGMEQRARGTARAFRPYNPLAYTLGDENGMNHEGTGPFADTPRVWTKFREYLRGVYPDMDALNTQWGTGFAAWDEIRFDSESQMLPDMDNPSAWVDYRNFVTRKFTAVHQRMRQAIREEHPGAAVGWDGVEQSSSYGGQDWWELTRDMEMVNTYHTQYIPETPSPWKMFNGEAIISFAREAPLRGCWMNRADREFGGAYVPWYLLLNGWNSAWWWQATFLHPANGPLTWDLRLTPIVKPMVAAVKEIKRGPGTLLAHARKNVSPIAIHYSTANFHASTIESGVGSHIGNLGIGVAFWTASQLAARSHEPEMKKVWGDVTPKGHYAAAAANFYTLLHDIGFEPRTMARQEIETDALATSGTRVLVLPFVVSLSDIEVQKIRQFVSGGGVLIADYRCGLRDGHGKIREKPALDDLFGIKRRNLQVHRRRAPLLADLSGGVRFESVFHDPVTSEGAESRAYHDDGTEAFFVHHHAGGDTDAFGWYRLRLKTPLKFEGKKLFLVFEAVDEDAHIYIDGAKVFEHSCTSTGLTPEAIWNKTFAFEVSRFLHPGDVSLLAVGVYNRHGMGGIHKPVHLVAADTELDLPRLQDQVRRGTNVMSLPDWRFALDEDGHGMDEKWYAVDFDAGAWSPMRADLYTGWQGQGFSGGKVVYLNTDLYGYIDLRRRGQERGLRELFTELIAGINDLHPPFRVRHRYGSGAGQAEVAILNDGDTRYYGVLPAFNVDDKSPRPVVLPFPNDMHVYNVRSQQYMGPGGPIKTTLYPGRPQMYAALPYKVTGLSVDAPPSARRGVPFEISIHVAAGTSHRGPHAVRVEVRTPDKRTPEYLSPTLYLPNGQANWSFVPALNSPTGHWTVCAVEAVSGIEASARFHVQ